MNPPKSPSRSTLDRLIRDFNINYPIGTPVILRTDRGELETEVEHAAQVVDGHSAVAWFKGVPGCHSIERNRVRLFSPENATDEELCIQVGNHFLAVLPTHGIERLGLQGYLTLNKVVAFVFRDRDHANRTADAINAARQGNTKATVEPWSATSDLPAALV